MFNYFLRRFGQSFLVLIAMSCVVFLGVFAIGNPIDLLVNPQADEVERVRATAALGLDRPLYEQYWTFLKGAASGDLGRSFVFGVPALELILSKMPATIELALFAMLIAVAIGIPLGLVAGLRPDSLVGRSIMAFSIVGFSLPTFWVGLVLIMFFAVQLGWLPSNGRGETTLLFGVPVSFLTWDGLSHLFLPAFNLALFKLSLLIRLTRAQVREAVLQDYVKFARAKGLSQSRVIGVHILKNIMIPIVTVIGLEFGSVIAFAIVTESIFAWPGTGKLLIDSINQLDRPVIVAYLMVIVTLFIAINFIVDLVYSMLDPRVRLGQSSGGGH
jgi:peptide/nickel transport system permease protein